MTQQEIDEKLIKVGANVIYKMRINAKPVVGRVKDIMFTSNGIRYAVYSKKTGMFLNGKTAWDALNNPKGLYVKDTRWVFIMWMKSTKIVKVL